MTLTPLILERMNATLAYPAHVYRVGCANEQRGVRALSEPLRLW